MESQAEFYEDILNDDVRKKIKNFLTPKKMVIVEALENHTERSQGELAADINSTPTALSNNLLKFDKFEYKLLKSRSEGKYRYYSLTELARDYLNGLRDVKIYVKGESRFRQNETKVVQDAGKCLDEFKKIYNDEWDIRFDDALLKRIRRDCKIDHNRSEELVDRFIIDVETLIIREDDYSINLTMEMLESSLLGRRLEEYLKDFYPLRPILEVISDKSKMFELGEILTGMIFDEMTEETKQYIQQLGWNGEQERIKKVLNCIAADMKCFEKHEIYKCFYRYLPGNEVLSAWLADMVWRKQKGERDEYK